MKIFDVNDLQPVDQIRLLQAHGSNGIPHGRFEQWLAKGVIEVAGTKKTKKAKKKKGKKRGKEAAAEATT